MYKNVILWVLCVLMASNSFAQNCPDKCQYPEHSWRTSIDICENFSGLITTFSLSREAIIGNTVTFNLKIPFIKGVVIDIAIFDVSSNGSLSPSAMTKGKNTFSMTKKEEVELVFSNFGKKKVKFTSSNGVDDEFDLEIKEPLQPYESPDAVWKIETPNIYNPANAGAQSSFFDTKLQDFLNATKGVGFAYVRYGKTNGVKRNYLARPIIYLDGIDFNSRTSKLHDPTLGGNVNDESNIIRCGATGWDVFITGTDASILAPGETEPYQLYRQHFDEVQDNNNKEGYDVIFLDFADGATYMQKNAEVLIELLKQINGFYGTSKFPERVKQDINGVVFENIIVGPSMGGQVAKFALSKMEYEEKTIKGPPHCTKMYVSFDSPHKGANIPIGIQGAAWYAAETCTNTSLWDRLNQPAARQLLVQHLANMVGNGTIRAELGTVFDPAFILLLPKVMPADRGTLRTTFLNQLTLYGNYPKKTNNIAITNGHSSRISNTFNGGDDLIDEKITGSLSFHAAHFRIKAAGVQTPNPPFLRTDFGCQSGNILVGNNNTSTFAFGAVTPVEGHTCGLNVLPPPNLFIAGTVRNISGVTNTTAFDNAPGSYRRDLQTLHNELLAAAKGASSNLLVRSPNFNSRTTFIHTLSAADAIGLDMTDANFAINLQTGISNGTIKTPFEAVKIPSRTLQHVEIDQDILTWVNGQLASHQEDLAMLGNLTNNTYNYGLVKNKIPSVAINSGGFLRVNNETFTAFLNEVAPKHLIYTCYLTSCGGSTVDVNEGGKFIMGNEATAANMKGIVVVTRHSVVNVNSGGTMRLVKGSELQIEGGGVVNLKGGISDLHQSSRITVQKDAILNITGGTLNLHDASRIIVQSGGRVIITGGLSSLLATSQFVVEQGGIVEVKTDAALAITEQSIFDVRGGKATFQDRSSTTISGKARLQTTGEVRFNTGQLTLRDEGLIQANDHSLLVFNSEMYISMRNLAAIDVVQKATLRFDGSPFAAVRFRGGSDITENTPIRLRGCKWIINAPMIVSSSVYFQVINDPSITYLNNLGFNLQGDGKRLNSPFRVLELMGVDFDIVNANIRHGKIIYQDDSSLGYRGGSLFTDVYFQGGNPDGQGVAAIINNNDISDALNISNCLFDNVDHCVKIEAHPTLLSGDINIVSTTATRFKSLGFDFLLNGNVNIMHSHFIASEASSNLATSGGSHFAPALRVRDMGSLRSTVVSNTVIESTVDWQHYPQWTNTIFDPAKDYSNSDPIYPPQNAMMQAVENSYLVGLFGVSNFHLHSGSEVRGGYIGILTDLGYWETPDCRNRPTNVSITCSRVHHNYTGIVMQSIEEPTPNCGGNVPFCGLILDAATIDENVFGIYGRNIAPDANLTITRLPSTFGILNGTGNGHYMCISYSNTAAPNGPFSGGVLLAPNNVWSSGAPVINVNYLLDGNLINAAPPASMSSDCVPNERHSTDPTATMASATDEQKAFITVNGVTKALLPLYWKGISEYLNNDVADAIITLSEITAIPLHLIQASDNPYLRSYHTLAWAIAPGPAVSDIGNQKIANIKNTNSMLVFPNPAEGFFKLVLPSGRYEVQLSDVLGRVIKQVQVADYEEISTENIESGLYQVTVRKQGEQAVFQTGKIVIKE